MSYGHPKVHGPSNFDDISTARSSPELNFMQGMATSPYGALPSQPTLGRYYPGTTSPPSVAYGQSQISTRSGAYSTFNGSQQWYQPEIRHSRSGRIFAGFVFINVPSPDVPTTQIPVPWSPIRTPSTPFIPPLLEDDSDASSLHSQSEDTGPTPHIQPKPPIPLSSAPVQSQAPAPVHKEEEWREEEEVSSTVPSIHRSHMPFSQQYPNLPKKSIFSRLIQFFRWPNRTDSPANPQPFTAIYPQPFTQPFTAIYPRMDPEIKWHKAAVEFLLVELPKQMYLLFLLRLPSLYFSRVSRIFEEADMSLPEIKKMALETASQGLTHEFEIQMAFESPTVPPVYKRLTLTWESFIDSVMREWKTFNIISVLLLSYVTFDCLHCFFQT